MPPTNRKRGHRGPYRARTAGESPEPERDRMFDDPDVVAFAQALERISDPEKRACIEWLVRELARTSRGGG
jgi:hypothetical protein